MKLMRLRCWYSVGLSRAAWCTYIPKAKGKIWVYFSSSWSWLPQTSQKLMTFNFLWNFSLHKTTMVKAMRTSQSKKKSILGRTIVRICVLKLSIFLSHPLQTATWSHQNLRRLRTETASENCFYFHSELHAAYIRYAKVEVGRRKRH